MKKFNERDKQVSVGSIGAIAALATANMYLSSKLTDVVVGAIFIALGWYLDDGYIGDFVLGAGIGFLVGGALDYVGVKA